MSKPQVRLPAEWEKQGCVMLSWPHPATDLAYMLDEAEECFAQVAEAIAKRSRLLIVCPEPERPKKYLNDKVDPNRLRIVGCDTNDTWARDFGPITIYNKENHPVMLNFQFNGWGLKFPACYDNQVNTCLKEFIPDMLGPRMINKKEWVLEGGSIDSDGAGTLLTTVQCLLSENRNDSHTESEINDMLRDLFGIDRVLWLENGALDGDDTDSHVDTLARFLPGDIIAHATCDREDDTHFQELKNMASELEQARTPQGKPYQLVPLPIPHPILDSEGNRLPATYANFLILNGAILLPVYKDAHYDTLAIERLKAACPDYEIVPIDCRALIQQHGSLHCITMQMPFIPVIFNS